MRLILLAAAAAAIATSALAAGMSVKVEMKKVVEPASNTLFAVGGDVDPANGPDAAKVPALRYQEAAAAAARLNEVAKGLSRKGRAKTGPEWARFVKDFQAESDVALTAAKAKDGAGLSKAANDLSDNCSACHAKFKPQDK